jgi:hypothetical protein
MNKPEFPPLLPAGFHQFELDELADVFVTPFVHSRRRPLLLDGLTHFVNKMAKLGIVGELWFDGSFVSRKSEPNDVDLLVVIDSTYFSQLKDHERYAVERAVDNARPRIMYRCDVYSVVSSNTVVVSYWRGWFGFQRDGKTPKGIGCISL